MTLFIQYNCSDPEGDFVFEAAPDKVIENDDGSKTLVFDCAKLREAIAADGENNGVGNPYETGAVYGYTLDGRTWDEAGKQSNSVFNWAKLYAD